MREGLLAWVVVAAAVLLAGCGEKQQKRAAEKAVEKAVERQTGGKVKADLAEGKIQLKSKDGETTIAAGPGAEIPDGFPKDVPVYKGAAVVLSSKQGKGFTLMLQSGDDLKKVASAYKADLKAQGWEEESAVNLPQGTSTHYKKGNRELIVTLSGADEKTTIQLTVAAGE